MSRPLLSDTLTALVAALDPAVDGATVQAAELSAPLEVTFAEVGGALTCLASPARSRFVSGFLAPVHRVSFTASLEEVGP